MRNRIILIAALTWLVFNIGLAQESATVNCAGKMVDENDSIAGTYTRRFKEKLVIKNSDTDLLMVDLKQFNDVLVFSVLVKGAGDCLDESSKMITTFVSGATVTLPMDGKFNCDQEFAAFFGATFGKKKEFRMFLLNEIESIKVETRKSVIDKTRKNFVEVTLNADQRKEFIQRLECLVGE